MALELATRLRFSAAEVGLLSAIAQHHMRPLSLAQAGVVTPLAAHRFFRDAGPAGLDVALLALADARALTPGPLTPVQTASFSALAGTVARLLEYALSQDSPAAQKPLLSGGDLIDHCGLPAGPEIGRWLRLVREQQVCGRLTTREEALQWVQTHSGSREESDGE
jgi:poly(A) polymerase